MKAEMTVLAILLAAVGSIQAVAGIRLQLGGQLVGSAPAVG